MIGFALRPLPDAHPEEERDQCERERVTGEPPRGEQDPAHGTDATRRVGPAGTTDDPDVADASCRGRSDWSDRAIGPDHSVIRAKGHREVPDWAGRRGRAPWGSVVGGPDGRKATLPPDGALVPLGGGHFVCRAAYLVFELPRCVRPARPAGGG
ncbi:hypothetical protein FMEAI12_6140005 [Parafrankia sp. Ea1.12]|nr:hypothetical protein FMEAI12_6140005 [Parafrankia sp. Ea1.12]